MLPLAGCVSAEPNFYNGHYYMFGDADCVKMREVTPGNKVMCFNANDQQTGYRDAMTDQQLYMHQSNQQMQQDALAQLVAAEQMQQAAQQPRTMTCTTTGPYTTNCNY